MRHVGSLDDEDDDEGLFLEGTMRMARMKDEIDQLRKEVAHWKRLVNEESKQNSSQRVSLSKLLPSTDLDIFHQKFINGKRGRERDIISYILFSFLYLPLILSVIFPPLIKLLQFN